MKKFTVIFAFLLLLCVLCSCGTDTGKGSLREGESDTPSDIHCGDVGGKLPYIADYAGRDLTYTVTVSDGTRSITLDVKREGKVTKAAVASPEGIAGTEIICDAAGLRVRPPYPDCRELTVSPDGAAGLAAVFDVMKTQLGRDNFTGGKTFSVTVCKVPVKLQLSADGFPESARLGEDGAHRNVTFTDVKLSDNGK